MGINEKPKKKKIEKVNETKSWFFKNINQTDKSLAMEGRKEKEEKGRGKKKGRK